MFCPVKGNCREIVISKINLGNRSRNHGFEICVQIVDKVKSNIQMIYEMFKANKGEIRIRKSKKGKEWSRKY